MESELHETHIKAPNYADLREIVILLVFMHSPHVTSLAKEICIFIMFPNTVNHVITFFRETLMWSDVLKNN